MKYRHRVLGGLFLLGMLTMVDRVSLSVAGQSIQSDLHLTPSQWGWVLGIFSLAYGVFEVPAGSLGDRVGPRRVLTRIVLWWSAFTALTGLARNFFQLIAIRFLFGAGEAGAYPNMSTVVHRWFPARERARAQGLIWMSSRLGGALAPLLVIPLQRALGWRATMPIFGLAGVVWAVVWYGWFRDRPQEKAGVTAGELAELDAGLTTSTDKPEVAHKASLRDLFRQPALWWLMAMYYTYSWSGYFYQGWLFTFLQNARGFTAADLLALAWLPFVCGALANFLGGFAGDALVLRFGLKWGRRAVGLGGLALSASLIGGAMLVHGKLPTLALLALGYAASDFMMPSAWATCLDISGERVGAVSGAMNMAGQAGGFSGSVAFGYIVSASGSYDLPLFPIALLTGFAALMWLKIDASRPLFTGTERSP